MSSCGVYLRTWGTQDGEESGITQFAHHYITNTNVGHASLEIVLPDTSENWQMIEQYLKNTTIPYKREKIEIKKIFYRNGQAEVSTENAYEEKIIKIYFSFWPSENAKGFGFCTLEEDLILEREGVDMPCAPEWESYLQPEKRFRQRDLSKIITLPPFQTLHFRGANNVEVALLQAYHFVSKVLHDIKALRLLLHKINHYTGSYISWDEISQTEKLLLKQFLPHLTEKTSLYIHTLELTTHLSTCVDNLTQSYTQNETRLEEMLLLLDEQEKENLLLALNVLNSQASDVLQDSNIKVIFSKYNLPNYSSEELCEWIKNILQKRERSSQTLATVSPLIHEKDTQIIALKDKIYILREIEIKIKRFIDLVQWSKYRQDTPEYLNKKREDVFKIINEYYPHFNSQEDIYTILIQVDNDRTILQNQKNEHRESRLALLKIQEQAYSDKYFLGNQSLNALIASHVTTGLLPDETVRLSLKTPTQEGLHPEKMLQQMAHLANSSQKFGIVTFNCSHAVSEVLAAGAQTKAHFFLQRAFNGSIVTPQVVYNNALNYLKNLTSNSLTSLNEEDASWRKYFANCAVASFEEYIEPSAPLLTKGWSAIKALTAATASLSLSEGSALLENMMTYCSLRRHMP